MLVSHAVYVRAFAEETVETGEVLENIGTEEDLGIETDTSVESTGETSLEPESVVETETIETVGEEGRYQTESETEPESE